MYDTEGSELSRLSINDFDKRLLGIRIDLPGFRPEVAATEELVATLMDDGTPVPNAARIGHELLDITYEIATRKV